LARRPLARGHALALAALASLVLCIPARAADPFYLDLLRSGRAAYERQDFRAAVADLRLACFGFLEEPLLLREGLVHLALAQAGAGDGEGFLATFARIADLERRFHDVSKTPLPDDVRGRFEAAALERVPAGQIAALPRLADLAERRAAQQLAELPPRQRRAELEKRAAAEPGKALWALELARADLDVGRHEAASKRLAALLAADPQHHAARCLYGRALADSRKCELAVLDLRACRDSLVDRVLATARLGCLVRTKGFAEARDVLAVLPAALLRDAEISKLAAKLPAPSSAASTPPASTVPVLPAPAAARAADPTPPTTPPVAAPPTTRATSPAPTPTSPPPATPTASPPPSSSASKPTAAQPIATAVSAPPTPPPAVARPNPVPSSAAARPEATTPAAAAALAPPPPSSEERELLETARKLMRASKVASDLAEAMRLARLVADAHPADREAQLLTAEIAYRGSRWAEAVRYFRAADPGDRQPALLFYFAVSLFETGDRAGAAKVLKRCLPDLQRTPIVDRYVTRILEP
jgi:tetratricopeptide (TPR) repeat protein